MTSSAILSYSIESIAELPVDDKLAAALLSSLAEYGEQLHGRRLWLACSGGRDSLALAALCVQLYQQEKLPFLPQLLHVNHGLQADSNAWASHVADWAAAQTIPCHILRAQVNGHDEQAARQARYDVMRAHINQGDVLLLGHHADDQAETVLMRLIQGAGVNGLSGMQPWRVQRQGGQHNILWRPWLTIQRAGISAYAQRLQLPYIDDPTNDTGDNVRSGLRRDIMPVLARYNPNVVDNIARSAQLLSEAQASISAQADADLQQTAVASLQLPSVQQVLSIDKLHNLPLYRQRQLLHYWLGQDEPLPPAKQLVDDVLLLSQRDDHDHQTELFWQGRQQSYTIRRYRHQLYRLSNEWLTWLRLPLIEQRRILTQSLSPDIAVEPHDSITLRSSQRAIWQLQIPTDALVRFLLDGDKGDAVHDTVLPILQIAPLHRNQRLKTALASRLQSGKKLYQTLGIPLWLRESLIVVSIIWPNEKDELPIELPLLLVSPFDSWALSSDNLSNKYSSIADKVIQLSKLLKSSVNIKEML
ncbi:tRNA lysidine(34) synthetase TilS [Psychrobacter sp. NG25]|uniref:tRNA lysidine(34) synthetase TilS n=1 Tax=Psychrobacter sp. NG25 TaxID=2782005 RepID=UPI0018847EC1|nr:tRNA lysidine(34) synthetase TilS [Psychrobacter sp. NG25]MBF0657399.1 tRNA lysidine(34) synthetase TilS [Psychrobacter sp. NG25]